MTTAERARNFVRAFDTAWFAEAPPFVIAVTGSRWLTLGPRARRELRALLEGLRQRGKVTLLHGGADGVDQAASDVAAGVSEIKIIRCNADWRLYGDAAGPKRNAAMLTDATHLLAFPGGRDTENCVRLAKTRFPHVTVVEVGVSRRAEAAAAHGAVPGGHLLRRHSHETVEMLVPARLALAGTARRAGSRDGDRIVSDAVREFAERNRSRYTLDHIAQEPGTALYDAFEAGVLAARGVVAGRVVMLTDKAKRANPVEYKALRKRLEEAQACIEAISALIAREAVKA